MDLFTINNFRSKVRACILWIGLCTTGVLYAQYAPNAICQDVTVQSSAAASLMAADFDGGSSGYSVMEANIGTAATAYNFDQLNATTLGGQDGWLIQGWSGALVTGSQPLLQSGGFNGNLNATYNQTGAGNGVSGTRLNDGNFSLPKFTGNETDAFYQVDIAINFWGVGFGPGTDLNGDGIVSNPFRIQQPTEQGPYLAVGAQSGLGVQLNTGAGSFSAPISAVGSAGTVRFRVMMDFQANTATVLYRNLTQNQLTFQPVAGLSNVSLGASVGGGGQNDPTAWNSVFFHLEQDGGTIDNIVAGGNSLPASCPAPNGPETVTMTLVSDNGYISTCTAALTVADNTPPTLTCPGSLDVQADPFCTSFVPDLTNSQIIVANSTVEFNPNQGHENWQYGQYPAFQSTSFAQLPNYNNRWEGTQPFATPFLDAFGGHPGVGNNNWAVRRWTSDVSGNITITGEFFDRDPNCGDGANVRIFKNGQQFYDYQNIPNFAINYTASTSVQVGDIIDFVIDAKFDAGCDNTQFTALITLPNSVTATDSCGIASITQSPAPGTQVGSGTTPIVITATDNSGNSATCTVNFNVNDPTPPSITCPADISVSNDQDLCGAVVTFMATATDNCGQPVITYSPNPGLFNVGTTTVTATATDVSGNTDSCTFDVTVNDTQAPEITCPDDTTLSCINDTFPAAPSSASATDNCPNVNIQFAGQVNQGGFGCASNPILYIRTYAALDAAGNIDTCNQTVRLVDDVDPNIVCPPDTTLSCEFPADPNLTGFATGDDNCGILINPNAAAFHPATGLPCGYIYEYELVDQNNETRMDTCPAFAIPGFPACPAGNPKWGTVELLNDDTKFIIYASVNSPYQIKEIAYKVADLNAFPGNGAPPMVDNTWTIRTVDSSKSSSFIPLSQLQPTNVVAVRVKVGRYSFFTGQYEQNPKFQDLWMYSSTWQNSVTPSAGNKALGYALQACNQLTYPVILSNDAVIEGACPGTKVINRTWSAEDLCQNIDFCTQVITVIDTSAPVLNCPADITVSTDSGSCAAIVNYTVLSNDNCSGANLTLTPTSGSAFAVGTTPVSVLAVDSCGNQTTCNFNVTVNDLSQPNLVCPPDLNLSCVGSTPAPDSSLVATDNCGSVPAVLVSELTTPITDCSTDPIVTVRTYAATDLAGNTVTCSQTIRVQDTTAPTINCPADIVVSNAQDQCGELVTFSATASDNCGGAIVTYSQNPGFFTVGTDTIVATATDVCGNTASCTFTVTVNDTQAPEIQCPADDTFDCVTDTIPPSVSSVNATDNCPNVNVVFAGQLNQGGFGCASNPILYTRTYLAVDASGNTSSCEQNVYLIDDIDPTITCPPDTTLSCEFPADPYITGFATGDDNCGVLINPNAAAFHPATGLPCGYVYQYDLVDDMNDARMDTCPSFSFPGFPACPQGNPKWGVVELLNDSAKFIIYGKVNTPYQIKEIAYKVANINQFPGNGAPPTVDSTWTIRTVDSSNTTSFIPLSQLQNCNVVAVRLTVGRYNFFTNQYEQNPKFQDLWMYSSTWENSVSPSAGDKALGYCIQACNQLTYPVILSNDNVVDGPCPGTKTIRRTWSAEDLCQNFAFCEQVINVIDTTAPTLNCPADITVDADPNSCDAEVNFAVLAEDNCSGTNVTATPASGSTFAVGTTPVNVVVTDSCGNQTTCNFNVTVNDNQAPVAVCNDITVALDQNGQATIVAADIDGGSSDNCGVVNLTASQTQFDCDDSLRTFVTLTVDDGSRTDSCVARVTVIDNTAPVPICQDITVTLDSNGQYVLDAALIDNGSSDNCGIIERRVNIGTFDCSDVGVVPVIFTVVDAAGNANSCFADVTVLGGGNPTAVCQDITVALDANGQATIVAADIDGGSSAGCGGNLNISIDPNSSNFDCSNIGVNAVTLTVTGINGVTDSCTAQVTVVDNTPPVAVCQDITVQLDATGNATISTADIDGGSTDDCGVSLSLSNNTFDCGDVGVNTVTLTATDQAGNSDVCTASVTVVDNTAPVVACTDITVNLDQNGNASITLQDVLGSATDNCATTVSLSDSAFDCSNIGTNVVTITATDGSGNSSTCTANVTIEDNTAPTAICQDITVSLNSQGFVLVQAADIDGGSTDNCTITNISTNVSAFGCGNIGDNPAILTVTDQSGNTDTCNATVTVVDSIPPVVTCQDITISLDANGQASVDAPDITGSVSDNCGSVICSFDTNSVSQTDFDCSDIGTVTVTLIARDVNGNRDSCSASVTVVDSVPPVAVCQDITVQLDGNGNATISAADVDGGSSDNCNVTLSISNDSFDCSDLGQNTVILTATDPAGNSDVCSATVTVVDNTAPTIACTDVTVNLDQNGAAGIGIQDVLGTVADNCSFTVSLSDSTFDCSNIGTNVVTITATDGSGNSSTCTANVTVEDNTAPTVVCADVTVSLDQSGNASISIQDVLSSATDNCTVSTSLSNSSFDCSNIGANVVTITATDGSGNTSTCTASVTVADNTAPVVACTDITIDLDQNGNASITLQDVLGSVSDNCAATVSLSDSTFDCSNIGTNVVTITATDGSGNSSTCTASVTVEDNTPPTIACTDVTVYLDQNGSASVSLADVSGNAGDNCSVSVSLSDDTFDCIDIGANVVTVTATDGAGNASSCTATVTVVDTTAPTAVCQDITLNIDPATGTASFTAADIDGGSFDNCDLTLEACAVPDSCKTIDFNQFSAGDNITTQLQGVGIQRVRAFGGIDEAWIFDSSNPTGGDWDLGTPNQIYGGPGAGNGGASNASSLGNILIIQENNNTPDDQWNGGRLVFRFTQATTVQAVTLVDIEEAGGRIRLIRPNGNVNIPIPAAGDNSVQTIPVNLSNVDRMVIFLEGSGAVAGFDYCQSGAATTCTNVFDCSNAGPNSVVLTATDGSGNSSSCTATVTVNGGTPTITCPPDIQPECIANVPAADLNSVTVVDNCGSGVLSSTDSTFCTTENDYVNIRTYSYQPSVGPAINCTQTIFVDIDTLSYTKTKNCESNISVTQDCEDGSCFYVTSSKNLSNVVLQDINGNDYKFDNLSGKDGYFCHPSGDPIVTVWVKAGCKKSGDGPGYGVRFDFCTGGSSLGSKQVAEAAEASGSEDIPNILVLEAYPNPTTDFVQVRLSDQEGIANGELTVKLVDATGRVLVRQTVVLESGQVATEFDLSNYAQGFYYIVVEGNGARMTEKVMRN